MKKKLKLSPNDQSLFKTAMAEVKPLKFTNQAPLFRKKLKPLVRLTDEESNYFNYHLSDAPEHQFIDSKTSLNYAISGVQTKTLKRLRAGKVQVEATLDLHGLTIDQARQQLSDFIHESQQQNLKCIIIVHGKGTENKRPRLKSMVNYWLPQIPDIIAFCSTLAQHGGQGAVYVLIKTSITTEQ